MAFVIPVLTTIGGGSAAVGATVVATAATVGATVVSARQSAKAGNVAAQQAQIEANAEGDAARQREIERRRLLIRSISAQAAAAGAAGVSTTEGSLNAMVRNDLEDARTDMLVDRANLKQRQRVLSLQGKNAFAAGRTNAAASLLDGVTAAGTATTRVL